MKTYNTTLKDIGRDWHLVDAKDQTVGRLSTHIAKLLIGKNKVYFVKNLDCGDYVVVINAELAKFTGNKESQKIYYHHTGYPRGLRSENVVKIRETHPERIIIHAVSGMLPNNKLKDKMLTRLYVYPGEEHPYDNKIKDQKLNIKKTD